MSGDPEHEFLADGLTEDIITALARLGWLFVIARNSTFVYKNKADRRARRRARSRRALRARGQRAHGRPAPAHHRPADRGRDRQARLGRPLRPRAGRPVRRAGRHHRARGGGGRAPSLCRGGVSRRAPSDRPDRRLGPGGARAQPDQQGRPRAATRRRASSCTARSRSSPAMRAPTRCSPGPNGGPRFATGSSIAARATANRPRTRRRRWRSIRSTRGRAWRWGWLFRRSASTTARSAS